jgi:hypothetical protein
MLVYRQVSDSPHQHHTVKSSVSDFRFSHNGDALNYNSELYQVRNLLTPPSTKKCKPAVSSSTLMMDTAHISKMLVMIYLSAWHYIPKHSK